MNATQRYLQVQDVQNIFAIFALLACILPVYYGFKKGVRQGCINTCLVGGVLALYFSLPVIQPVVNICFMFFVIITALIGIKNNVFS